MQGFESGSQQELLDFLSQFVSPHKRALIEEVLESRTRFLTVVLEDVFQSHNACASLRTCEALGVQDVHVIENRYPFDIARDVTLGASHWLSIERYQGETDSTAACLNRLKSEGYRIVATTPHGDARPMHELPITTKTAFLFGHENDGLSETALHMADDRIQIPTVGFMESLNLSVSVAVILQHFTHLLRQSDLSWRLTQEERETLRLRWVRRITRRWRDSLEADFKNRNAAAART